MHLSLSCYVQIPHFKSQFERFRVLLWPCRCVFISAPFYQPSGYLQVLFLVRFRLIFVLLLFLTSLLLFCCTPLPPYFLNYAIPSYFSLPLRHLLPYRPINRGWQSLSWYFPRVSSPLRFSDVFARFAWAHYQFCPQYCIITRRFSALKCLFGCFHLYWFQLRHEVRVPFPCFPACSSLGAAIFISIHALILVFGCKFPGIASILPIYALLFSITRSMWAFQGEIFISTPSYVKWSTIGNSSPSQFRLNCIGLSFFSPCCHSSFPSER